MILALLLVITGSAVSASAEEFENTAGWLNLYDYNPSMNRNFTSSAGATRQYVFDLPARMRLYDIDIVMFVTGGAPDVYVLKGNGDTVLLNKVTFGNNMVRYYGYIYYPNYDNVTLLIGDSVAHSGTIISASVCTAVSTSYSEIGSFRIQGGNYNKPIDQTVTMKNSTSSAHFVGGSLDLDPYVLYFTAPNWVRYDFMDFVVSLDGVSVDSVSAFHKGRAIDVDYELINGTYSSNYHLVLRLDLTGLDRDVTDLPTISVTGQMSEAIGISLVSVKGVLNYDVPNPYLHWLSEIHTLLTKNLTSIISNLTDLSGAISTGFSNLKTSITTMNTNLGTKLDALKTSIVGMSDAVTSKIATMNTNIGAKLDTLKTYVTTMNTNLGTKLDSILSSINSNFTNLKTWLSSGFKSVTDKLDVLINGSSDQQNAANEFQENASQQSGQINSAVDNMNVAKPPADNLDTSVESITGGLNFAPFNTAILTVSSTGTVYRLIFLAVSLMLVSYVFFGKKV